MEPTVAPCTVGRPRFTSCPSPRRSSMRCGPMGSGEATWWPSWWRRVRVWASRGTTVPTWSPALQRISPRRCRRWRTSCGPAGACGRRPRPCSWCRRACGWPPPGMRWPCTGCCSAGGGPIRVGCGPGCTTCPRPTCPRRARSTCSATRPTRPTAATEVGRCEPTATWTRRGSPASGPNPRSGGPGGRRSCWRSASCSGWRWRRWRLRLVGRVRSGRRTPSRPPSCSARSSWSTACPWTGQRPKHPWRGSSALGLRASARPQNSGASETRRCCATCRRASGSTCAAPPRCDRCCEWWGSRCPTPGRGAWKACATCTRWWTRCSRGARPNGCRPPSATPGSTSTWATTVGSAASGPGPTAQRDA